MYQPPAQDGGEGPPRAPRPNQQGRAPAPAYAPRAQYMPAPGTVPVGGMVYPGPGAFPAAAGAGAGAGAGAYMQPAGSYRMRPPFNPNAPQMTVARQSPPPRSRGMFEPHMRPIPPARERKSCNCKHSRCLKLYCECFASGEYCMDICNCNNCANNTNNEAVRAEAVSLVLNRNRSAFRPKIGAGKKEVESGTLQVTRHTKGCHCKKSGCLKKYCECFQAGIACTDLCRCADCKNLSAIGEVRVVVEPPVEAPAVEIPKPAKKKPGNEEKEDAALANAVTAARKLYRRAINTNVVHQLGVVLCTAVLDAEAEGEEEASEERQERAILEECSRFLHQLASAAGNSLISDSLSSFKKAVAEDGGEDEETDTLQESPAVSTPARGKAKPRARKLDTTPTGSATKKAKR